MSARLSGRKARLAAILSMTAALIAISLSGGGPAARGERLVPSAPSTWRLTPKGIGPLRLGMKPRRARALAPGLRVYHHRFCDTWRLRGLGEVAMFATHDRGGLSGVSIGAYSPRAGRGHGGGGVEIGQSLRVLRRRYGPRLHFVKRIPSLHSSFYRVYSRGGRRTALEFTIDRSGHLESEEAGFVGEFYSTDGVELCA